MFTSEPKAEDVRSEFTVGRLNIRGAMKLEWLRHLLEPGSSVLGRLERQYKVKTAAQSLLGDRIYAKAWSVFESERTREL